MKTLLLLALLLFPLVIAAQSFTVQGIVRAKASREGLPGAGVVEKGTTNGTTTDAAGHFTLVTTRPRPRLLVSFIGHVTQEVAITKNEGSLVVLLAEDTKMLPEAVVTVLGVSREKRSMSYSGSSVASSPKGSMSMGYAAPAAAATVPGVRIRGASSLALAAGTTTRAILGKTRAGAGVLTAGEVNDFGKWKLWPDIAQKDLSEWRQHWQINPQERYSVQVITDDGFPVVGVPVLLKDSRDSLLWQAQSDNTGKCELWNNLFAAAGAEKVASLQAVVDGKTYTVSRPTVFHDGINSIRVRRPCQVPAVVDIAFVVDATGSMGDEIQYLQAELGDVIAQAKNSLASSTIHLGSVFYRDAGDEYVTRKTDISPNIQQTLDFIHDQQADGGGDFPEAVDKALAVAMNELTWTPDAKARLLFLILDAPPHEDPQVLASLQQSIRKAAAQGIRLVPITASGIDKSTEYLMRAMALATNGTYVFLTNDSGVGNTHIKPTTDKFDVELLNTLLVKLIAKYAYTTDCQHPVPGLVGKTGTLSGQYRQVADTVAAAANPALPGHSYSWKCYPNPASEVLHVELEGAIKELFITDVTGKVVLRAVPVASKATIPLSSFPTGVYFLQFFTGRKWERARFLVSR